MARTCRSFRRGDDEGVEGVDELAKVEHDGVATELVLGRITAALISAATKFE